MMSLAPCAAQAAASTAEASALSRIARSGSRVHPSTSAYAAAWTPYPFNSGYFMAFKTKGSAEVLRRYLLEHYQVGCINIANVTLRLAYCSVECDKIEELVDLVHRAAGEVWS